MTTETIGSQPKYLNGVEYYTYDANGNMTSRTEYGVTYTQNWNEDNKLSSVTSNGTSTSFAYDADGNRIKKVESGSVGFSDNFGGLDSASWGYNTALSAIVDEAGQKLVRLTSDNNWRYTHRTANTLSNGKSVALDFRLDNNNSGAHFVIEDGINSRFGVYAANNTILLHYINNGGAWSVGSTLVNGVAVNTWYRLTITVDDVNGFKTEIRQRDSGAGYAIATLAMPAGRTWHYKTWMYYSSMNAWLDNYIERSNGSQTTVYVGGHFEKNTTTGVATSYYVFNGQTIAMRQGSTVSFLHGDHLGSASLTTNNAGAKIAEARYAPFGEMRYQWSNTPTDKRFEGQRFEGALGGIYDFNARYLNSLTGRFLSADSIVPGAGDPQNFNRYSFVLNNPLRNIDPTGHCTIPIPIVGPIQIFGSNPCPWDEVPEVKCLDNCNEPEFVATTVAMATQAAGTATAQATPPPPTMTPPPSIDVYPTPTGTPGQIGTPNPNINTSQDDPLNPTATAVPQGGVYVLIDKATGQVVYVGRTNDVDRRREEHARDPSKSPYQFQEKARTDDKDEQRGLEQYYYDKYSPKENKIKPIATKNPNRDKYIDAAEKWLQKNPKAR